ncbi:NAD(P)-binding domain-containing protein [Dactylosporangium sp. NPDC005555]|uniref:NAD(P)-binding domain-containing protein n=1 Tax=Dactylosporangium sp. NPDC005555 TaxID=3154889 RepID=UPI0033A01585
MTAWDAGSIGIISAGRVGATLAAALSRAGLPVVAVAARSTALRRRAEQFVPDVPVLDPPKVAACADVLLLAVTDDALGPVIRGLVTVPGAVRAGQMVAHVSGVHGTAILQPARAVGAHTVAICPAMTFTGRLEEIERLPGVSYATTVDGAPARAAAQALIAGLGGRAAPAALVTAAEFLNAL